jgi:hypothetical protein
LRHRADDVAIAGGRELAEQCWEGTVALKELALVDAVTEEQHKCGEALRRGGEIGAPFQDEEGKGIAVSCMRTISARDDSAARFVSAYMNSLVIGKSVRRAKSVRAECQ